MRAQAAKGSIAGAARHGQVGGLPYCTALPPLPRRRLHGSAWAQKWGLVPRRREGEPRLITSRGARAAMPLLSVLSHAFQAAKSAAQVLDARKKQAGGGGKAGGSPCMPEAGRAGGSVAGPPSVQASDRTPGCRFAMRPGDGRPVLAGAGSGRPEAADSPAGAAGNGVGG